jgi:calcineurin-like phosphoesterase family protein
MKRHFTADTHFWHRGVIHHCRPWASSVEHMNETIIQAWNSVVADEDEVYHLGDFSFAGTAKTLAILDQLRGRKHLILGNHDKGLNAAVLERFVWVDKLKTIKIPDPDAPGGIQRIVLCHYPMLTWDMAQHGTWHLHGHSHGNLKPTPGRRLDVGTDTSMIPWGYEGIKARMKDKTFETVDHHSEKEPR